MQKPFQVFYFGLRISVMQPSEWLFFFVLFFLWLEIQQGKEQVKDRAAQSRLEGKAAGGFDPHASTCVNATTRIAAIKGKKTKTKHQTTSEEQRL